MPYLWTHKRITERWGVPFWDLVRDIFDQGFNRTQAARILGMNVRAFNAMLRRHEGLSPWGSSNIVATYVNDTGEPFLDALLRMQREGYSLAAAGRAIGFRGEGDCGLKHAMKTRGLDVKFTWVRPEKKKSELRAPGPNMYKGWPTWKQIYAARNRNEGATVEDSCDSVTVPQGEGAAPLPMIDV